MLTVHHAPAPAGGEEGPGGEPVDLVERQSGVGDGLGDGFDRQQAEGPVDVPLDHAVGVAGDGHLAATGEPGPGHRPIGFPASRKWGTETPSATSSKTTSTGTPMAMSSGPAPTIWAVR